LACEEFRVSEEVKERVDLTVALDTDIFINVKNKEEPYYKYSRSIIEAVDGGMIRALISAVVVAEMCTGYYMFGDIEGRQEFHISWPPHTTRS
jgi:predicted nucleic acid-binding protein